jgi:hypothetical protein
MCGDNHTFTETCMSQRTVGLMQQVYFPQFHSLWRNYRPFIEPDLDPEFHTKHTHTHCALHIIYLLYHCTLLQQQRKILEKNTLKHGIWPISKHDLITKHLNSFMKFTNSIEFDKLKRWRCNCKVLRDIIQWLYIVKECSGRRLQERQTLHPLPITKN